MSSWTGHNVSEYRASADVQNVAASVLLSFILAILFIAGILFNGLLIFVFIRIRQIRRPANYLLINVTGVDLVACFLWIIPSLVSAATWRWIFGDGFCVFHSFACTLCLSLTSHTFVAIAFEKFLRFWWPAKHGMVFHKKVVIILLMGIWCFDLVIACLPLMGWGKVAFSSYQFQCSVDYEKSISHLNFSFVVLFAIPFVLSAFLYLVAAIYIRRRLRQITPGGKDVLQEDKNVPHESYTKRLEKQGKKVQDQKYTEKMKKRQEEAKKAKNNKSELVYSNVYGSSSDNSSSSEEELPERVDDYITRHKRETDNRKRKRKRIYVYKPRHYLMTLATFVAWLVYMLLWLPYWIITYYWALNYWEPPSWGLYSFFTLLTFFGVSIKILIYAIFNRKLVQAMWYAFCGKKKEQKVAPPKEPEPETVMYTTSLNSGDPQDLPIYATTFRYLDD